jgi:hypothetical protein
VTIARTPPARTPNEGGVTMEQHVTCRQGEITFEYVGKSGIR